jgi:hypothetical protein
MNIIAASLKLLDANVFGNQKYQLSGIFAAI